MFKKGDKVKCISGNGLKAIKTGEVYTVSGNHPSFGAVFLEGHGVSPYEWFFIWRFEKVEKKPKEECKNSPSGQLLRIRKLLEKIREVGKYLTLSIKLFTNDSGRIESQGDTILEFETLTDCEIQLKAFLEKKVAELPQEFTIKHDNTFVASLTKDKGVTFDGKTWYPLSIIDDLVVARGEVI